MSYMKDQQQEFRELASWVIDQTLKAGAKECKVNISKRRSVEINYRERKPEIIKEATTQGLYLDVFYNNRYAGKSTPDFRKSTLEGFITDLIDNARIMEEDPFRTLPDPKYYSGRSSLDLQLSDPDFNKLLPEDRHAMAKVVEDACLKSGGDKVISVEAGENDDTWEEFTKTSNGFEGFNKGTNYSIGASMTLQDEGDRRPNGYYYVSCRYKTDLP